MSSNKTWLNKIDKGKATEELWRDYIKDSEDKIWIN
jgi:hypothetical protein